MKRNFILWPLLFFSLNCFAAKIPKWFDNVEAIYPRETFLAVQGSGINQSAAQANALGQIAGFFKTQVTVQTNASTTMTQNEQETKSQRTLENNVSVYSNLTLNGIEYSDFYFDKKKKIYYVVGFLNRELASQKLEEELNSIIDSYFTYKEFAQKATDPVLQKKYLNKAFAASENYLDASSQLLLLNPALKRTIRSNSEKMLQDPELLSLESSKIPIGLNADGDVENIISNSVISIFESKGFIVQPEKTNLPYILNISIATNEKIDDEIISIFPEISISLSTKDNSNCYFSFRDSWTKTAGFSMEQAKKKAYTKLVPELTQKLKEKIRDEF